MACCGLTGSIPAASISIYLYAFIVYLEKLI
nr:MAG TPA: hypothetical protein [Bacteriophage sp.]